MTDKLKEFYPFFYPRTIAVIGVSPEPSNLGKNIVMNCLAFGYQGEVLSVGLKEGVVCGQRIYPSLDEIEREIDLVVILTPARTIPGLLEQCGRKGIRHVVIESAGFSELNKEGGYDLEKACMDIARRHGIRMIGPNGLGVTNLEIGLALPFMSIRDDLHKGTVSVISQSGGVGQSFLGYLADENIGVNKFISCGNKLDVNENELLEYLIQDPGTKIILVYLEGFSNGRGFIDVASRSDKPILVFKSNRFPVTARIAHSHTAALFTEDDLISAALQQAGCVRIHVADDAVEYTKVLTLPPLKGNRLVVVSRSGGHAVIATDACAYYGFQLPVFPEGFLQTFESRFRGHVIHLQNPLDLGDLFELEFYGRIIEEMLKREDVDGILIAHGYPSSSEEETEGSRAMLKKVSDLMEQYQKPIAMVVLIDPKETEQLRKQTKMPIFSSPENAIRAFSLSHAWSTRKPTSLQFETMEGIKREEARVILQKAQGRNHLLLSEAMHLMEDYGFSIPPYSLAKREEEAVEAWRRLKTPVAMKVNAPFISHKTDFGAVLLHLNSEEEIRKAFLGLREKIAGDLEVLIQPMVGKGREVILGAKRDKSFGPVLLFGLGGIFVEVLHDVVWRVAPINREDARQMILEVKGIKILQGVRGEGPYDIQAIEDLLLRLSSMMVDFPEIQEVDINPVMVFEKGKGAVVVDARVVLNMT